ncbi:hypothetical protein [Caproicibacter sp. BJN0012]|uniref:hypothetical protein n=1 Tax=Caproicibacter sp. BJN0012 TaxID=3110227 RepID=UPI002E14C897
MLLPILFDVLILKLIKIPHFLHAVKTYLKSGFKPQADRTAPVFRRHFHPIFPEGKEIISNYDCIPFSGQEQPLPAVGIKFICTFRRPPARPRGNRSRVWQGLMRTNECRKFFAGEMHGCRSDSLRTALHSDHFLL